MYIDSSGNSPRSNEREKANLVKVPTRQSVLPSSSAQHQCGRDQQGPTTTRDDASINTSSQTKMRAKVRHRTAPSSPSEVQSRKGASASQGEGGGIDRNAPTYFYGNIWSSTPIQLSARYQVKDGQLQGVNVQYRIPSTSGAQGISRTQGLQSGGQQAHAGTQEAHPTSSGAQGTSQVSPDASSSM